MVQQKKDKPLKTGEDFDEFLDEDFEDKFDDNFDDLGDDVADAALPKSKSPPRAAPKPALKKPPRRESVADDVDLPPLQDDPRQEDMLDVAADVPVQVVAVMGKKNVTIKEIAALKMGEVVELGRPANEIVDLVAGGKLIAKGELVEIEGKLGVRIVKMVR